MIADSVIFKMYLFICFMCVRPRVYMWAPCMCRCLQRPEEGNSNHLMWVLGANPRSSTRVAHEHWAISPAPLCSLNISIQLTKYFSPVRISRSSFRQSVISPSESTKGISKQDSGGVSWNGSSQGTQLPLKGPFPCHPPHPMQKQRHNLPWPC